MIDVVTLIAVVVAVTEGIKRAGIFDVKFMPLFSVLLGIVGAMAYLDGAIADNILYGVMIGLSASGLFDQSKIVTKK